MDHHHKYFHFAVILSQKSFQFDPLAQAAVHPKPFHMYYSLSFTVNHSSIVASPLGSSVYCTKDFKVCAALMQFSNDWSVVLLN